MNPPRSMQHALRWLAGNLPAPLVTALRYRRERRFIAGHLVPAAQQPSVVFFTVRKCASTMMRRLLADVARRRLGLTPLNLVGYLWDALGEPDVYGHLNAQARRLFLEHGVLYAPLRRYVDVSHLREARVFAMLRDPRDVTVSAYYSERYSHRAPANRAGKARFAMRRDLAATVPFDEWIRQEAGRTLETYAGFRRHLDRARVLTYEDMWADFDAWLDRLGGCLGLEFSAADRSRYRSLAGLDEASSENPEAHRRKGVPGDYKDKLPKPLADELTALFADDLRWLYG